MYIKHAGKITHIIICVCRAHTPYRSQYAAITLTMSCTSSTYPL